MTEAVTAMRRRMKHSKQWLPSGDGSGDSNEATNDYSKQWLLSGDGSGDSNEATNEAQQTMASVR